MYEHFYSLSRRPFRSHPQAGCWYSAVSHCGPRDELLGCLEQGLGIGVLLGPAGSGKTALCKHLLTRLPDAITPIYLPHGPYSSRPSLLRTLLMELGHSPDHHSEHGMRIQLMHLLSEVCAHGGRSHALIVDEAHLLAESILDELRILADYEVHGRPVIRLLVAAQFPLEEKLALPELQPFNHRIRVQTILPHLTAEEAIDYLDYQLTWAGGRTAEIMTREALETIAELAGGLPRAINYLADHCLLLGYVRDVRPITHDLVCEAIEDLKHLALPWNWEGKEQRAKSSGSEANQAASSQNRLNIVQQGDAAVLEIGATPQRRDQSPEDDISNDVAPLGDPELVWITRETSDGGCCLNSSSHTHLREDTSSLTCSTESTSGTFIETGSAILINSTDHGPIMETADIPLCSSSGPRDVSWDAQLADRVLTGEASHPPSPPWLKWWLTDPEGKVQSHVVQDLPRLLEILHREIPQFAGTEGTQPGDGNAPQEQIDRPESMSSLEIAEFRDQHETITLKDRSAYDGCVENLPADHPIRTATRSDGDDRIEETLLEDIALIRRDLKTMRSGSFARTDLSNTGTTASPNIRQETRLGQAPHNGSDDSPPESLNKMIEADDASIVLEFKDNSASEGQTPEIPAALVHEQIQQPSAQASSAIIPQPRSRVKNLFTLLRRRVVSEKR